ncbi:MAG: type II toxin-antitoxin system VapC family toxin [Gammaproteobacteria bacterium]|nr:type II toxin-antitoxin system VapC family toxin [Gammaproteobacteria bacterium]MYF29520.1 type II toxin-antitoxin system VapC family toxin [Gammaproteobacteria bacterium]
MAPNSRGRARLVAAKIIVLDNSINARLLWPDSESPDSNQYALDVLSEADNGSVFHVPTIWHYEVAHVAAKLVRTGEVSQASAVSYFEQIALLPIVTDVSSHANATQATFALSVQLGLSVYDAAYLELVLRLGADLATNDKRLRAAAARAGASLFLSVHPQENASNGSG